MKTPLSVHNLIIPVLTAMAAIAIIALALIPEPDTPGTPGTPTNPEVLKDDESKPHLLNPAPPVPAPRP